MVPRRRSLQVALLLALSILLFNQLRLVQRGTCQEYNSASRRPSDSITNQPLGRPIDQPQVKEAFPGLPEANVGSPEVKRSSPEVNTSSPEVNTSLPEVNTSLPEVNTSLPEVNTNSTEVNTSLPDANSGRVPLYSNDRVINPYPFRFVHEAEGCDRHAPGGRVFLLMLVACRPEEASDRSLIRSTWGSVRSYRNRTLLVRFLVGRPVSKPQAAETIQSERVLYGDLIESDFDDTYYNMTYKVLMGLRWAALRCPDATYVMNMDSDMFVNIYNLVKHLETAPRVEFVQGRYKSAGPPIRNPGSKWYTPPDLYPEATYPPYPNGPSYVLSNDLPKRIFEASAHVRYLPWDDVFVGLVLKKIGVKVVRQTQGFEVYTQSKNTEDLFKAIRASKTVSIGHRSPQDSALSVRINTIWKNLTIAHLTELKQKT